MNKSIFTILLFALNCVIVLGQSDFGNSPKYWLYKYRYFETIENRVSYLPDPDVDIEVFALGEIMKNGKLYQKIGHLRGHFWNIPSKKDSLLVRWDEGRVYVDFVDMCRVVFAGDETALRSVFPCVDNEVVLYDFTLGVGDQFGRTYVSDVSSVTVGGEQRKLFTLATGHHIVEGLGSLTTGFFEYMNQPLWLTGFNGPCVWFLQYYNEDGQNVFYQSEEEAYEQLLLGIKERNLDKETSYESHPIYNLQGRVVRNPIPGHIYIQDGMKYIAR